MVLKRELGKNNNRLCDWSFEIISLNLISSQWARWHDCLVYMRSRFIRRHCQNARQQQVANIIYSTANNIWEERVSVCTGVSVVYLCPSLLSSPSTCKSVLSLYVAPTAPSCVVVTTEHSYWKATLLYMYVFYYYSSILITTVETCASSHTLLPNGQWWEVQVIWIK